MTFPPFDLVIVDLYPFEQTVAGGASAEEIIEKIDIGGISLIRAGAKNFKDVVIVPSKAEYGVLLDILNKKGARTDIEDRKMLATRAFGVSSHYDTAFTIGSRRLEPDGVALRSQGPGAAPRPGDEIIFH
jgi:phosphoribosylaminoimidazolecarboxamide formyltransferase/IMP cyclohydrolase